MEKNLIGAYAGPSEDELLEIEQELFDNGYLNSSDSSAIKTYSLSEYSLDDGIDGYEGNGQNAQEPLPEKDLPPKNSRPKEKNPETPGLSAGYATEGQRIVLPLTLTSDEKLDWTLRFVSVGEALRKPEPFPSKASSLMRLAALERDFLQTAKMYVKIIIDEKFLPHDQKTIKSAKLGGVAGGLKYYKEGILFKFALDSAGLYGGDINAMKSAGHEMKCLASVFGRLKEKYSIPLVSVIDHKGFRVIAISLLPILDTTIVYGSNNGGRLFHSEDDDVNEDMEELGVSLNLQQHQVSERGVVTRMPADIEVHCGMDGRYYLVDVARLWPPEPPSIKGSWLYRMLREEFVTSWHKPLCSDGFSGFLGKDPQAKALSTDVRTAFVSYIIVTIPMATQQLGEIPIDGTEPDITLFLHQKGINLRHMGLIWQYLPVSNPWRRIVMNEIVARAAKSVMRSLMRRSIERLGLHVNEPFSRIIASYLNLLLGTSEESEMYWRIELKQTIEHSFFYISNEEKKLEGVFIRREINEEAVLRLLTRMIGVTLKESFWNRFSVLLMFNRGSLVEERDIESIEPVLKRSHLSRFADPIDMVERAEYREKGAETVKTYKATLRILFEKSSIERNNKFLTFRYACRVLASLPFDSFREWLPRIISLSNDIWTLLEESTVDFALHLRYYLQDYGAFCLHSLNIIQYQKSAQWNLIQELFHPYFLGIVFSDDKDLLKSRTVLSQDIFNDIHTVDFSHCRKLPTSVLERFLRRTTNLRKINVDGCIIRNERIVQAIHLNDKFESFDAGTSFSLDKADVQLLFAHRHLTELRSGQWDYADDMARLNLVKLDCGAKSLGIVMGEMSESSLQRLCEMKHLKSLAINGEGAWTMSAAVVPQFASAISQVEELSITTFVVPQIEYLLTLPNLKALGLKIKNDLLQQTVTLSENLKLEKLSFLTSGSCSPNILVEIFKHSPELRHFDGNQSVFDDRCCWALLNCPKMETLRLNNTKVTRQDNCGRLIDFILAALGDIAQLSNLKVLTLRGIRDINDDCFQLLAPLLPNLEELDLRMCPKITDVSGQLILLRCRRLSKLKLPGLITNKSFEIGDHAAKSMLKCLDLYETGLNDAGMEIVIDNYPSLESISTPLAITNQKSKVILVKLRAFNAAHLGAVGCFGGSYIQLCPLPYEAKVKGYKRFVTLKEETCT